MNIFIGYTTNEEQYIIRLYFLIKLNCAFNFFITLHSIDNRRKLYCSRAVLCVLFELDFFHVLVGSRVGVPAGTKGGVFGFQVTFGPAGRLSPRHNKRSPPT